MSAAIHKLNLLLVDDRPENLLALEGLLGDLGHNLVKASSGPEALQRLLQDECALVLLDVQMPGMDGFETAQLIRKRPKTLHLPIIFITAINTSEAHVSRGYALGAVDYLFKPVRPEVLKAKVAAFIGMAQDSLARSAEYSSVARTEQTERQRIEADLRLAHRLKDEYVAMLGHELRNPLAAITNASYLLHRLIPECPPITQQVGVIDRQAKHLARLVDDLLDVTRIKSGKLRLRCERIDVRQVIEQIVEDLRPMMEKLGHELTRGLSQEALWVEGDPVRLAQVLANLLTNAAQYTDPGGRVWVTATAQDSQVVVSVSDNGVGIPPEVLPHVFEPFFQAERTLDRSPGGLGIGLSTARMLVEMHGGTLQALSAGAGQGSELLMRLRALEAGSSANSQT